MIRITERSTLTFTVVSCLCTGRSQVFLLLSFIKAEMLPSLTRLIKVLFFGEQQSLNIVVAMTHHFQDILSIRSRLTVVKKITPRPNSFIQEKK